MSKHVPIGFRTQSDILSSKMARCHVLCCVLFQYPRLLSVLNQFLIFKLRVIKNF